MLCLFLASALGRNDRLEMLARELDELEEILARDFHEQQPRHAFSGDWRDARDPEDDDEDSDAHELEDRPRHAFSGDWRDARDPEDEDSNELLPSYDEEENDNARDVYARMMGVKDARLVPSKPAKSAGRQDLCIYGDPRDLEAPTFWNSGHRTRRRFACNLEYGDRCAEYHYITNSKYPPEKANDPEYSPCMVGTEPNCEKRLYKKKRGVSTMLLLAQTAWHETYVMGYETCDSREKRRKLSPDNPAEGRTILHKVDWSDKERWKSLKKVYRNKCGLGVRCRKCPTDNPDDIAYFPDRKVKGRYSCCGVAGTSPFAWGEACDPNIQDQSGIVVTRH